MATRSYTSRRELDEHTFHPAVALLVPIAFIVLQALLPKPFPGFRTIGGRRGFYKKLVVWKVLKSFPPDPLF